MNLQFNSATYYIKQPTEDSDVTLSTTGEYLSHFEEFVTASLCVAEELELWILYSVPVLWRQFGDTISN